MYHWCLLAALLLSCSVVLCADVPKVGDMTPDVSAPDENGNPVKLSSFKDKSGVIIFFYPRADTPG